MIVKFAGTRRSNYRSKKKKKKKKSPPRTKIDFWTVARVLIRSVSATSEIVLVDTVIIVEMMEKKGGGRKLFDLS